MATKKSSARKYSPAVSKRVETEMWAMKKGTLKSGGSGEKVTNPKQAIAIALSEARRAGKKVPPPVKPVKKKTATKKPAKKRATSKKAAAKKSSKKKTTIKG